MSQLKIFSRYNVPPSEGITFIKPSMTQQHFADETDINQIIRRAVATQDYSVFTPTVRSEFYDCSTYDDYQSSINFINDVEDDFASLPSHVRKEFGNNPDAYVAFMTDPANISKAVELGLLQGSGVVQEHVTGQSPVQPAVASQAPTGAPPVASVAVPSSQSDA
ncbi:internal scaffolding protein [robinz microvirus RP_163]|nr:internal scaffolding protein [robinz microvirus RP_37]UDN67872.1 internal scaffolding protein [robinz microvirus RP_163]